MPDQHAPKESFVVIAPVTLHEQQSKSTTKCPD